MPVVPRVESGVRREKETREARGERREAARVSVRPGARRAERASRAWVCGAQVGARQQPRLYGDLRQQAAHVGCEWGGAHGAGVGQFLADAASFAERHAPQPHRPPPRRVSPADCPAALPRTAAPPRCLAPRRRRAVAPPPFQPPLASTPPQESLGCHARTAPALRNGTSIRRSCITVTTPSGISSLSVRFLQPLTLPLPSNCRLARRRRRLAYAFRTSLLITCCAGARNSLYIFAAGT